MAATTLITGNTYPVKEKLKALGGRWDAAAKGWRVPANKADEARAIVAAAGPEKPRSSTSTGSRGRYGNRRGRWYTDGERNFHGHQYSPNDPRYYTSGQYDDES